ncbi:MAG: ribonuclease HII [Thermodesulfobacteriota bacterium]|nr:ribonuclease HII [Thermodesulfobacteriota bacterium]
MKSFNHIEDELLNQNKIIAGVDEVGRGSLMGPIVTCAFLIKNKEFYTEVDDSKLLSESKRNKIFVELMENNPDFSLGFSSHIEVDKINVLNATKLAMLRAIANLEASPDVLLIDGNQKIDSQISQICIPKGDRICKSIAAASIIAKVVRDFIVKRISTFFPYYGFARNKGYGTKYHKESLRQYGPSPIHRKSFKNR